MYKSILFACTLLSTVALTQAETTKEWQKWHEEIMVLDTHLDTPMLLVRPGFDIMQAHTHDQDFSQVDIPRMNKGGLDGGFWVIYSPQGPLTQNDYQTSRDTAVLRAMAIHNMAASNPDVFGMATEPNDGPIIHAEGKKIVYISMENAYPLGEDLSLLNTFYKMGLRMLGPVHFKNNQFGDSSTDPDGPKWGGLSPLGKELVKEANRLGIILDGSHASDELVDELIDLSETPIILSHTGTKTVYDHPRNIDDALLKKLAKNGGLINVNAYSDYLKELPKDPERTAAYGALFREVGRDWSKLSVGQWKDINKKRFEIDQKHPAVKALFEDYMEHFLHILDVVGPKHVGVGADWDGGGGVVRMMDVATLPLISERLVKEGYSKQDLEDIWGKNVLRLLDTVQSHAKQKE